MKDEIFGPLLPIVSYDKMEAALAIVRLNPNPLAFYLFTGDRQLEKTWIGAYHGKYSFDTFSHVKPVLRTPVFVDPAIKYPPFKGKMKWFKLFLK